MMNGSLRLSLPSLACAVGMRAGRPRRAIITRRARGQLVRCRGLTPGRTVRSPQGEGNNLPTHAWTETLEETSATARDTLCVVLTLKKKTKKKQQIEGFRPEWCISTVSCLRYTILVGYPRNMQTNNQKNPTATTPKFPQTPTIPPPPPPSQTTTTTKRANK